MTTMTTTMTTTMISIGRLLGPVALGLVLGAMTPACTDAGGGDDGTEGLMCEHGTSTACTCTDGSMGTQMCSHDSSGFEPCVCGGDEGSSGSSGSASGSSGASAGSSSSGSDPSTETGADGSTGMGTTVASADTGPVGAPPTAQINHPGDAEERVVGVPIPFIGMASDPEDGDLAGASLVWTDSVEGEIGQGEQFDAALITPGDHIITLTATDADGNVGESSISLVMVEP
jgi:hypothetical protein